MQHLTARANGTFGTDVAHPLLPGPVGCYPRARMRDAQPPVILRSRRVVPGHGSAAEAPLSIHIEDGIIQRIAAFDDVPPGARVHDVGERVIMPGVVDSHVHLNEPGRTEWEGFTTGTRAAAAGGVTTLVDMPLNSIPPTTTVANLREKRAAAAGQCWVDVGFWGGAVPGNAGELRGMLDAGALGFKCFMVASGVDEFPNVETPDLEEALRALSGAGAPLLVHAELSGPIEAARAVAEAMDPRTYAAYLRSRPKDAEDLAIARLIGLARQTRARVHVVHLSSSSALDLLREARGEGLSISAETTPHYLTFTAEEIPDGATPYKCAPPIRERDNQEALWAALARAEIDLVVSDHSPCTPALKRMEAGDFAAAWGGIASLQLGLPAVWTGARRRGASLADLTRWMSAGPAELAGLSGKKGRLAPGYDGDLVIWDPEASFRVEPARIEHRHKVTPYAGRELFGVVHETWLRGQRIYGSEKGEAKIEGAARGNLLTGRAS
jgi:allantoinase